MNMKIGQERFLGGDFLRMRKSIEINILKKSCINKEVCTIIFILKLRNPLS